MKQNLCVFAVLLVLFSATVSGLNEEQGEGVLLVKPGKCLPSKHLTCPVQSPPNECILDVDCDGKKKCCFTGCTMICAAPTQNKAFGTKVCEVPVDLAFLIDSSASIGENNFNKIKKMMHRALNIFTISEKKTRVGAVMIDSVPKIVLNFNTLKGDALNAENVGDILQRVQFFEGKTRIDLALRSAYKELFIKAAGSRRHARKILLVFTDGGQTGNSITMLNLTKSAQPLIKMGVQIFPVALWDNELNIDTLLDIASDHRNVFNVEFYPELLLVLKKIAKVHCTGQAITMIQKDPVKTLLKRKQL